mgnify:CR=1 FL=1
MCRPRLLAHIAGPPGARGDRRLVGIDARQRIDEDGLAALRGVVDDAGLNAAAIAFSARAVTNWHNILAEAIRQARRHQQGVDHELVVLLIHGTLHLCGYDHERSEPEAKRMARRERAVLRDIGSIPSLLVSDD